MKRITDVFKDEARKRILNAGIKALADYGEQGLKVAHVAKEAGIANGTFYLYFRNKTYLIEEILRQISAQIASTIISIHTYFRQSINLDRAEIEALIKFAQEFPKEFEVIIDSKLRTNFDQIHPLQSLVELRLRIILQENLDNKINKNLNAKLIAEADTTMLFSCIQAWLKHKSTIQEEELIETMLHIRSNLIHS